MKQEAEKARKGRQYLCVGQYTRKAQDEQEHCIEGHSRTTVPHTNCASCSA